MRKRFRNYILAAVVGAMLGFGVQMSVDFCCWCPPGAFLPGCTLARIAFYDGLDEGLELNFSKRNKDQALGLLYQAMLLDWLGGRGDVAARTSLLCAFLSVSAVLAREHRRQQHRCKKQSPDGKAVGTVRPDEGIPTPIPNANPIPALSCEADGGTINMIKKEVVEK